MSSEKVNIKEEYWAETEIMSPQAFLRKNREKREVRKDLSSQNISLSLSLDDISPEYRKFKRTVIFPCWVTTSPEEVMQFITLAENLWEIKAKGFILRKDTGRWIGKDWKPNPYVAIEFCHKEGCFPVSSEVKILTENGWNKEQARLQRQAKENGKEYHPLPFSPPPSWEKEPLEFMIQMFSVTIGKEKYSNPMRKRNFRKKEVKDYR